MADIPVSRVESFLVQIQHDIRRHEGVLAALRIEEKALLDLLPNKEETTSALTTLQE